MWKVIHCILHPSPQRITMQPDKLNNFFASTAERTIDISAHHVDDYASIIKLIQSLPANIDNGFQIRTDCPCWSESCANAFNRLKRALISAPVLAFPNFDEQFLLYVDASSTGIGFAFAQIQNGKVVVIAYNGRGLNQAERNYTKTEREALALVAGIKKF